MTMAALPEQTAALPQQAAIDSAVRHLISKYSPKGNKVGWLMMASILVEAWDLYSIAFVLIFIKDQYQPDPFMLGLAAAGTQGGALIGALLGGWLSDKIGRRIMFLATMILFIVLALAQAFVSSVGMLIVIRFLLGVPLGSESRPATPTSWNPWPRAIARSWATAGSSCSPIGEVLTLAVIAVFLVLDLDHETIWRVTLGLGALPALIILIMRHDVPETAVWLVQPGTLTRGQAGRAGDVPRRLDMLPNHDVVRPKVRTTAFLADLRRIRSDGAPRSMAGSRALPRQRILDLRVLSAGAVRDGRRVDVLGINLVTMALFASRPCPAGSVRC